MNQPINDGGPAFPLGPTAGTMRPAPDGAVIVTHYGMERGMTLRDCFAASALQGLCATIRPNEVWSHDELATTCYRISNAMLKAREAKP